MNVTRCWGCGAKTSPIKNAEPHDNWKDNAAEVRAQRVLSEKKPRLIPLITATIQDRNGQLFISSWEVIQGGWNSSLQSDKLIEIDDKIYEVLEYLDSSREYWVRLRKEEDD